MLLAAVEAVADREVQSAGHPGDDQFGGAVDHRQRSARRDARRQRGDSIAWAQGNRANATLGRALRLVLQNIGGALPGEMDRATQGQPGKYTFCCAENEAASPWQPLHVERGFIADESTVTVVGAAGTLNMNTHAKDAADLLRVIALSHGLSDQQRLSLRRRAVGDSVARARGSSAARRLVQGGRQARLWEQSKMEAGRFARKDFDRAKHTREKELGEFSAETQVPIAPAPEDIGIIVAGGPGTHSVYVPTFGQTRAVSRKVKP